MRGGLEREIKIHVLDIGKRVLSTVIHRLVLSIASGWAWIIWGRLNISLTDGASTQPVCSRTRLRRDIICFQSHARLVRKYLVCTKYPSTVCRSVVCWKSTRWHIGGIHSHESPSTSRLYSFMYLFCSHKPISQPLGNGVHVQSRYTRYCRWFFIYRRYCRSRLEDIFSFISGAHYRLGWGGANLGSKLGQNKAMKY